MAKLTNLKIPSKIFRILGSESALKIFFILGLKNEMSVSSIAKEISLSMPATSHHLQRMESTGLINSRRMSRTICYALTETKLNLELLKCLRKMLVQKKSGKID